MAYDFLNDVDHRPWPLPKRRWNIFQSWQNLLFAHYRVPVSVLREHIPEHLTVQEFDGSAWIGIVPFYLVIRPRYLPVVPGLSKFPEINVRTYVEHEGKPGVWFFSLDASNQFGVWAARRFFHLPYYNASIEFAKQGSSTQFASERSRAGDPPAQFRGSYHPQEPLAPTLPGSLEHFLTERYCLYTADDSERLIRLDVHHAPWSLHSAKATIDVNTMTAPVDIDLGDQEPMLHYADRIDVVCWSLERLSG